MPVAHIDGFTRIQVVESDPERVVLDARYRYRDRNKDENSEGMGNPCVGYGKRRFVLANREGAWQVQEMSGAERGRTPRPEAGSPSG